MSRTDTMIGTPQLKGDKAMSGTTITGKALGYGLVLLAVGAGCAPRALAGGWGHRGGRGFGVFYVFSGPPANSAGQAHAPQGYLGVDVRDVTEDQVASLKLHQARGAEITLVDHDAPAGKANLREHDVVLQMNGQEISGEDQIRRLLRDSPPGRTITLVISRDGQPMTVVTQMGNREEVARQAWEQHHTVPEPAFAPALDESGSGASPIVSGGTPAARGGNSFMGKMLLPSPSHTGVTVMVLNPQLAQFFGSTARMGLIVSDVQANSPAALAGMRIGDVVVRADSRAVATTKDWFKAIARSGGRPVTVVVVRDKREQTLTLTPDSKKRSSLEGPELGSSQNACVV